MAGAVLIYPRGAPGAGYFPLAAKRLGLSAEPYDLGALATGQAGVADLLGSYHDVALLVLPTSTKIDRATIRLLSGRVRIVGSPSTGTDHADLGALADAGIAYLHSPGANARSVVEYVLGALMQLDVREAFLAGEREVGLVGYGRIGSLLGRVLRALEIPFVFCDPFVVGNEAVDLERALAAPIVSFHVPLTTDGLYPTAGMITPQLVDMVKRDATVLNTARGGIMSSEAHRKLAGHCRTIMDVFPQEPPEAGDLLSHDLVSPHIAGYNFEARAAGSRMVAEGLLRTFGDNDPLDEISEPEYDHFVVDFLPEESAKLKRAPESFMARRSAYPARGSFRAFCRTYPRQVDAGIHRVFEALAAS